VAVPVLVTVRVYVTAFSEMLTTLSPPVGVLVTLLMDRLDPADVERMPTGPVQSLAVILSMLTPPSVSGSLEPPEPPVQALLLSWPDRLHARG
jgi:hypothetical protein